jgi:hypothetical protein
MKILISFFLVFFCVSCFDEENIGMQEHSMIDSLLSYHDCVDEFRFSKMVLYSLMFERKCVRKKCINNNVEYDDTMSMPLYNFILELDTLNKGKACIEVFSDTIVFSFALRSKENCLCYKESETFPRKLMIERGTRNIYYLDYGPIMMSPELDLIEKRLKNTQMIEFVKKNKNSIDPWFFNELVREGYINSPR